MHDGHIVVANYLIDEPVILNGSTSCVKPQLHKSLRRYALKILMV
jgi:hypothetical protein